jgi:hypothetical protein
LAKALTTWRPTKPDPPMRVMSLSELFIASKPHQTTIR